MKVAILYGSVRETRLGIRAAYFIQEEAKKRNWEVTLIDPMEYKLPFLDKMYKEMKEPEPVFKALHDILEKADGYIIATAEYNHSLPPALKNLLDHYQKEYFFKPSAILSYSRGMFGGVRSAEHLRSICAELGMPSIPINLAIPKVHENFEEDGTTENEIIQKNAKRFLDEFAWYMKALKDARQNGLPY